MTLYEGILENFVDFEVSYVSKSKGGAMAASLLVVSGRLSSGKSAK